MKKLSAYQKLKLRVAELEHDLNEVVLNPDSFDAQTIKQRVRFVNKANKCLLMGSRSDVEGRDDSKFKWCFCDEQMLSKTIGNPHISEITLKPQPNRTETEKP